MQRESITVLEECIDLQKKKSNDYQNPNSNIVQSMHYRRGVSTIHDMIHQKLLRAQSLLEAAEHNSRVKPNFESLEDTYKDLINYASFAVSYMRGKMEGQDLQRNMFNVDLLFADDTYTPCADSADIHDVVRCRTASAILTSGGVLVRNK